MFDEMARERLKAKWERGRSRPLWQIRLIGWSTVALIAACVVAIRVGDGPSSSSKPTAAVRAACPYVDKQLVVTLFNAPGAALTEALGSRQEGFTRYTCLIQQLPALSLQLDLDVYAGTLGPDNVLPAIAVSGETTYAVHDTDGVLVAAKRAGTFLYAVTLTGSTTSTPAAEDKLKSLAASVTGKLGA